MMPGMSATTQRGIRFESMHYNDRKKLTMILIVRIYSIAYSIVNIAVILKKSVFFSCKMQSMTKREQHFPSAFECS